MGIQFVWNGPRGPLSPRGPAGILGIVNLTPDSFYDGGQHNAPAAAIAYAHRLIEDGADILDLGGESSRPGATPLSICEEMARLLPVIDSLRGGSLPPLISVDTYHAGTAAAVLEHGASIINDISAATFDEAMPDVLAQYKPGYILMHCQGHPENMQNNPSYTDVLSEVSAFFERRMNKLVKAGLPEENILLDPGIGFGKKACHNLTLMAHPEAWSQLGRPSLMALSMKSVFGDVLGLPLTQRGDATQVATALTFMKGYTWHRVHDVKKTRETLKLAAVLCSA